MSKYKILREQIEAFIETETETLKSIKNKNSCAAGMSMGAIEAYTQVLSDINELEQTISVDD